VKIKLYKLLSRLFLIYLRLVKATGELVIENKHLIKENTMVGYWHGDSFCMQMILSEMAASNDGINVIVTADKRGDIIENMINSFGAKAIRLPDGIRMRQHFRELIAFSKEDSGILATSFDGPLGPLHEPKKLIFLLASEAGKQVSSIHFKYKGVIRIKRRWDKYVIALPFCKITAVVEDLGVISKEDLRSFEKLRQKLRYYELRNSRKVGGSYYMNSI